MKNWVTKKLGEVCELSAGGDVPKGNFSKIKTNNHQIPIYANGEKNEGFYGYTNKAKVTKPSITVSARGTIGYAVKRLEPFFPIVRLIVVTPNDLKELCLDYLDYALRKIDFKHSGSSIPQLTVPMIKDYEIPIPPLTEQQRIVAILDEAFAAIAKAKANAEQNLKNAKELFESYLQGVFENKGEGWEEKTLGEVVDFFNGFAFKSKDVIQTSNTQLIRMGNLYQNQLSLERKAVFYPDDFALTYKKFLLKANDLIISLTGTTDKEDYGYTVRIPENEYNLLLNQRIAKISIKNEKATNKDYLFHFLLSRTFLDKLYKTANGTRQANLSTEAMKGLSIKIPNIKQQQIIVQKLDALSAETKKLEAIYLQKINDLEELKKSVLQKAFSGELKTDKLCV
jgi:type I restriction enzyme S subunit